MFIQVIINLNYITSLKIDNVLAFNITFNINNIIIIKVNVI